MKRNIRCVEPFKISWSLQKSPRKHQHLIHSLPTLISLSGIKMMTKCCKNSWIRMSTSCLELTEISKKILWKTQKKTQRSPYTRAPNQQLQQLNQQAPTSYKILLHHLDSTCQWYPKCTFLGLTSLSTTTSKSELWKKWTNPRKVRSNTSNILNTKNGYFKQQTLIFVVLLTFFDSSYREHSLDILEAYFYLLHPWGIFMAKIFRGIFLNIPS